MWNTTLVHATTPIVTSSSSSWSSSIAAAAATSASDATSILLLYPIFGKWWGKRLCTLGFLSLVFSMAFPLPLFHYSAPDGVHHRIDPQNQVEIHNWAPFKIARSNSMVGWWDEFSLVWQSRVGNWCDLSWIMDSNATQTQFDGFAEKFQLSSTLVGHDAVYLKPNTTKIQCKQYKMPTCLLVCLPLPAYQSDEPNRPTVFPTGFQGSSYLLHGFNACTFSFIYFIMYTGPLRLP